LETGQKISVRAHLSPVQNQAYEHLLLWISETTGLRFQTQETAAVEDLDLIYMCGLPASKMLATHAPLAAPVLSPGRYRDQPVYFTDVVTGGSAQHLPELALSELAGQRFAYNHRGSFSGWVALRLGLAEAGIDLDQITWVESGSHHQSQEMVRVGEAEAAGIDSMIRDLTDDHPPVASFGPWPMPPIMVSGRLHPDLVADLADAIASYPGRGRVKKWVAVPADHLAPIVVAANRAQ
jgi:ABC-type phosphate/phosphonate transport system substrate-binding protein